MLIIWPTEQKVLTHIWNYKFLTAQQLRKLVGNKSIQVIYENLRKLYAKKLMGSIVYGGVSRTGTMQKLHYLTRKWAIALAWIEQLDLEQIKYPKATNTLVKNDFLHRISTLDLMIAYDKWIDTAGHHKLFFDVYFDTNGSQRDQKNGALRSKTRIEIGNQGFIDPDGIFAFEQQDMCRIFVLEMANGFDTKRIVEQIKRNLMASYHGLVGDKYGLPHTATLLVVVEYDTMLKNVLQRVKEEMFLQKFDGLERYLFYDFLRLWWILGLLTGSMWMETQPLFFCKVGLFWFLICAKVEYQKQKEVSMSNFTRKPQETEGSYFFSGRLLITQGVEHALTIEEIYAVYGDVKAFVEQENGIDYLQVYQFEDGRVVWLIDQLNKGMIESGDYETEDNHCTMLLPEEYWIIAASWLRSSFFVKYDTQ